MDASETRVLAIDGSAQKDGHTAVLLRCVLKELEMDGIRTELIELADREIHNCLTCRECSVNRDRHCVQTDDIGNELISKMSRADGILFGSPNYATDVSPKMKALMDRACMVAKANDQMFRHKVGAAVISVSHAGAVHTFDALNHFFLINEMIVPGSSFWHTGIASEITDADVDTESFATMRTLGKNMAWLFANIKGPKPLPDLEDILAP